MKRTDPLKKTTKAEYPFPVRVLLSSFPVAVVILAVLWLAEYPPEEWPFISGVFALSLLGAGTVIGYGAVLAVNQVYNYASAVADRQGIDLNRPDGQTSGARSRRVVSCHNHHVAPGNVHLGTSPLRTGVDNGPIRHGSYRNSLRQDSACEPRNRSIGFLPHHRRTGLAFPHRRPQPTKD